MQGLFRAFFAVVLALFPLTAFAGEVIKVGGTGAALGTIKLIADKFEKANPGIKVEILKSLGSSGGIKARIKGAVDIGLSGRPLKEDEKAQGAMETEYARSPFVFVTTNKSISNITTKELVEIYEGKKLSWPDGKRVRLILRPEGDADTLILKNIFPEKDKTVKTALSRPGMKIAVNDQDNAEFLSKTPDSLGAIALTQVSSEKLSLRVLTFNGIKPDVKALAAGKYPLRRPFYLITARNISPAAKKFISFIFSKTGRKILAENGNIVLIGEKAEK